MVYNSRNEVRRKKLKINNSNNNKLKELTLFFQGPILSLYKMFVSVRA